MSGVLYRLGHLCVRRRRPVVALWCVFIVGVVASVVILGAQTSNNLTLPGTGSTKATDVLAKYLPREQFGTVPIVLVSDSGKLTDSANRKAVNATVKSLAAADGVYKAVSPLSDKGSDALSKDGKTGYISLTLTIGPDDLSEDEANTIIDAAQPARDAGLEVSAGGYLGQEVSKPSTHVSEVIGLGFAVIILLFAFGTATAMSLPIVIALVSVIGGLSLIGLLGNLAPVATVAPTLGLMIGLGVGIDYSLFIVTRYREKRQLGVETHEAIARTVATTGSAIVFAGSTVVIALVSLLFAQIPIVTTLGYSAALVVVVAVCAAVTLLPALLALLGARIDSLKVPFGGKGHTDHRPHGWARWAEGVARHPWPAMTLAIVLLIALAIPVLDMRLGQEDNGELPESTTARQAYDAITEGFGVGTNGPLLLSVKLNPPAHNDQKSLNQLNKQQQQAKQKQQAAAASIEQQLIAEGVPEPQAQQQAEQQAASQGPSKAKQQKTAEQKKFLQSTASDPRLVKLQKKVGKAKDVKSVSGVKVSSNGDAAVFSAIPKTAPSAYATQDVVNDLRDNVLPSAPKGVTTFVGGTTASYIDLADLIGEKLPSVIVIVVALAFLLLMLAFRSLVVPATAALMNLLSVAAAYGVLTAVFEKGFGLSLIGLPHETPIQSFVPLLMFAILFGLSMDYQVFLLSRVREHYAADGDNRKAVIDGVATSARVITSAALIMVTVFASFILNGDPVVKQFGVGLSAAIAVDATIVRCLLVPATMVLLGKSNWWLPGWLERILPHVGLESEESLPPLPPTTAGPRAAPVKPEPAPSAPDAD